MLLNFLTVIQRKFIQSNTESDQDEHVHNQFRYMPVSLYSLVKNQ